MLKSTLVLRCVPGCCTAALLRARLPRAVAAVLRRADGEPNLTFACAPSLRLTKNGIVLRLCRKVEILSIPFLKKYIEFAKATYQPTLTEEVSPCFVFADLGHCIGS